MGFNLTREQYIKRQKRSEKLSAVFLILTGITVITQIFEMGFKCMGMPKTIVSFDLFFSTTSSRLYFIFAVLAVLCLGTAKYYKTVAELSK